MNITHLLMNRQTHESQIAKGFTIAWKDMREIDSMYLINCDAFYAFALGSAFDNKRIDSKENKFSHLSRVMMRERYTYTEISEEELNNILKAYIPCNCDVGTEIMPDIVIVEEYDLQDELSRFLQSRIDKQTAHYGNGHDFDKEMYQRFYDREKQTLDIIKQKLSSEENPIFHKKACLVCKTCLDEKNKMFEYFAEMIDKDSLERQRINQARSICDKSEAGSK